MQETQQFCRRWLCLLHYQGLGIHQRWPDGPSCWSQTPVVGHQVPHLFSPSHNLIDKNALGDYATIMCFKNCCKTVNISVEQTLHCCKICFFQIPTLALVLFPDEQITSGICCQSNFEGNTLFVWGADASTPYLNLSCINSDFHKINFIVRGTFYFMHEWVETLGLPVEYYFLNTVMACPCLSQYKRRTTIRMTKTEHQSAKYTESFTTQLKINPVWTSFHTCYHSIRLFLRTMSLTMYFYLTWPQGSYEPATSLIANSLYYLALNV